MREAIDPGFDGPAAIEDAPLATLPVGALHGVTEDQAEALGTFSISTVFDLAAAPMFNAALELVAIGETASATERQLGLISSSLVDTGAARTIEDLGRRSPEILRNVGPRTAASRVWDRNLA